MNGWIQIDDVQVDLESLRRLAHTCDPLKCRHTGCCCKNYEVSVEPNEVSRVVGSVPDAAKLAPALIENGSLIDPIDEDERGHCLNTDQDGQCVFAYQTDQGAIRCSMHTLALQWNLPPETVKPQACTLWPLAIDTNGTTQLSVQDDALAFPCNTPRNASSQSLHPGIADIISAIFGKPFLSKLETALKDK